MADQGNQETYRYDDLPSEHSFRVAELLPGQGDDPISCRIRIVDWTQRPDYEAVSYTWGDANNVTTIDCHGRRHKITKNLYNALRHLRFPKESRFLWADALCTNQSNIPERGNQVNQMKKIYHHAQRVLQWLGEDTVDHKAESALSSVRKFATFLCDRLDISLSDLRKIEDVYEQVVLKNLHKLPHPDACDFVTDEIWEPLAWLYSHTYFSRAWVIQEINSNQNRLLHCGNQTIDWESIQLVAAYFIMESAWLKRFGFSHTFCWWVSTVSGELRHHGKDWLHMLYLASNFFCADPRDIIYSLKGMIQITKGDELLRPNYANSVLEVYRNSVEAAFINFKNTDALLYTTEKDDPSWIPQWNQAMLFRNPFRFGKDLPWCPSGVSKPVWEIDKETNSLSLSGFVVDTVDAVEPYNESYFGNAMFESPDGRETLGHVWQRILGTLQERTSQLPLSRKILQATALAFCFGLNENSDPGEHVQLLLNFTAYLQSLLDAESFAKFIPTELSQEAANADGRLFGKPVWNFDYPKSTFFVTSKKLIGCSTSTNEPGDLLFVANGSTFPMMLRPRDDHFVLRGFSWVNGLMHGELKDSIPKLYKIR